MQATRTRAHGRWGHGVRALAAALLLAAAARAEVPQVGVNPGAPIWNGTILLNDALAADIAGAGCRLVRVNFRIDGNPTWTPAHLARYDTIIQTARSHNLQVLGLICYEAVPGTQAQWNENYDTTGMNAYIAAFAETAGLLINRYKSDIKLFELWNEPDCWSVPPESNPLEPGCFYIWPRNYANLLAETYKQCVAQGGPDFFAAHGVALATGGLFAHDIGGSFSTSRPYMESVYGQTAVWDAFQAHPHNPAGRRYPWDYFGYHFYLNQGQAVSTTELGLYFNDIRALKSGYADPSGFLVTEFGWNTQAVSLQLQADNLRNTYNWLRAQPDVVASCWYQWNDGDGGWGLVYSVGNPKPSYYEFAAQCGQVGAPVAAFSAAPTSGRAPLLVQFSDESAGLIDTYAWDFGDGGGSGAASPQHEYGAPGTYTVSLTVTGPGGSDSLVRPGYIRVRPAADLDGDGDVDLADLARFARCFSGAGQVVPPPGCECDNGPLPEVTASYELAGGLAGLSAAIAGDDALAGRIGVLESGGFHGAVPGGDAGGLADLTDGVAGGPLEAVLADYAHPSLQVRYDLPAPLSIERVHVFTANADGRVFQNYDVQYAVSGDPAFRTLWSGVTTGPFGQTNGGAYGAGLTRVAGAEPGPIAVDVVALRFVFQPVSNLGGVFLEPGAAYVASLVKEIDVLAYTGPPPVGNVADLDGDGDADADDFLVLEAEFTGP